MRVAEKKQIPWGLFIIASIFLFNPNIAIFDFLPDFIGYIILSIALTKLAMINDHLYEAKRAFDRLIIIDVGKILAILWVFGMTFGEEQNSSLLLWSFVFGVLEILFAIPAFVKLFEGLSTLGDFYTNSSIHGSKRENGKSYTQKIKSLTSVLIVFKAVMTVLPELSVLETMTYDETSKFVSLYRYIGVMRGFCFIPVLIIGIVWLVRAVKYFSRIRADKTFVKEVDDEYSSKKITRSGLFIVRDVKIATLFLVLGSILSLDFIFENVNIVPDILVVPFFALSLFYFSKVSKIKKKFAIVSLVIFSILTIVEECLRFYFFDEFYYNAINKNGEAFYTYVFMVAAIALKGILLVVVFVAMSKVIKTVVADHTGYVLGREIHSEVEQNQILEIHKRIGKNFSNLSDFAAVCVLADLCASLYGAFYAFLDKNFGWISLISVACTLLLVGKTVKAVSELREGVQTKYMLQ